MKICPLYTGVCCRQVSTQAGSLNRIIHISYSSLDVQKIHNTCTHVCTSYLKVPDLQSGAVGIDQQITIIAILAGLYCLAWDNVVGNRLGSIQVIW